MLNLAAVAGDGVTQAYTKLWKVNVELENRQRRTEKVVAEKDHR